MKENTPSSVLPSRSLSNSISIQRKPIQFVFCLGDEGLSIEQRLLSLHSYGDLKKHLNRKNLRYCLISVDCMSVSRVRSCLDRKDAFTELCGSGAPPLNTPRLSSAVLHELLISLSLPDDFLKSPTRAQRFWFSTSSAIKSIPFSVAR